MANNFTSVCNLTQDPEVIKAGDRELVKIRVADNTWGKKAEPRYFNVLLGGPDFEAAQKLRKGDQVCVTGTLVKTSYKATKGKNKGKTMESDEMPFGKLLQVTRSETFFSSGDDEDGGDEPEPDIHADPSDEPAADPLRDLGL